MGLQTTLEPARSTETCSSSLVVGSQKTHTNDVMGGGVLINAHHNKGACALATAERVVPSPAYCRTFDENANHLVRLDSIS